MRLFALFTLLGFQSVGLVGCGGSSELSYQDYCEQSAKVECEGFSTCGGAAGLAELGYGSVAECIAHLEEQASCTGTPCLVSGLYHGTYHPDKAQICLDADKARGCSGGLPADCREVCTYE